MQQLLLSISSGLIPIPLNRSSPLDKPGKRMSVLLHRLLVLSALKILPQ